MKVPKWSSMLFSDVSWTKPSSYLEAPINPPYIFLQDEAPEMAKLPHKFVSELAFWWIKKNIHGLHVFATNMAWFQTVFHVFFFVPQQKWLCIPVFSNPKSSSHHILTTMNHNCSTIMNHNFPFMKTIIYENHASFSTGFSHEISHPALGMGSPPWIPWIHGPNTSPPRRGRCVHRWRQPQTRSRPRGLRGHENGDWWSFMVMNGHL